MDDGESDEKVAKDVLRSDGHVSMTEKRKDHSKTRDKILVSSLIKREKIGAIPKKKKVRKGKPTSYVYLPSIDTSRAKSAGDVINMAIRKLRWREFQMGRQSGCDFYWFGGAFDIPDPLPDKGMLNKFPGMSEVAHKVELTKQLNRMKKLFPEEYSFYPKTWMLPSEYTELIGAVSKRSNNVFIVKPDLGSQGDGIFLMNNPDDVHFSPLLAKPCIVQRYIQNPLLLEKLKFDLRIYVILKSIDPLEIYVCREGMARFCTESYNPPSTKNIHKCYMHLTNYSVNKQSTTYVQSDEHDKGSKRKLSCVFNQLERNGEDTAKLWSDIDDIICRTIIAFIPNLKIEEEVAVADRDLKVKLKCFQILGFDILIDSDLRPILLEVNSSPSLRIDHEEETSTGKVEYFVSATDVEIKLPVVIDTMKLAYHFKPRRFVGVRVSSKMGPTSFRMMASGKVTAPSTHHHHTTPSPHHHRTITAPSPHHHHTITTPSPHHTITTPSPHHHRTITTPHHHRTITAPSPHHHHTITTPSPHHHRTITTPSPHHHRTITAPSPHHHHTITTPSPHHHRTITAPSPYHHHTITVPSPYHHRTITVPSPHHHRTITAPSPHHHHTITVPSPYHHRTITTPSPHHTLLY
ncbi:hypothetical protein QZH41_000962 [Actinostola sp. cb2023]|nr:hypothetical protein QZH41_000962 [Actinostola sp. cb2023]